MGYNDVPNKGIEQAWSKKSPESPEFLKICQMMLLLTDSAYKTGILTRKKNHFILILVSKYGQKSNFRQF